PPMPPTANAPDADARARDGAEGAAALRATQELELEVIELRHDLDAFARERASVDDLRRRMDALDARRPPRAPFDDWSSLRSSDDIRFSQNGFVVRSPDDRFLLRPGLRLQAGYEGVVARGAAFGQVAPDLSTIRLSHAELLFEGHAGGPRFEYRFELDFADTATGTVKDAFVQWRFLHDFGVRAGRVRVPFGLEATTWNGHLELVDVAAPTAAFGLDRDEGVELVGRPLGGKLQFQAAALNGHRDACPATPTDNLVCDAIDLSYAARVVAAPLGPLPIFEGDVGGTERPLVAVGASGVYSLLPTDLRARTGSAGAPLDLDGDHRVDNVGVWQVAAELRAMFRGAAVQAEWFGRREQPGASQANRDFWGVYGQASYFVIAHHLQAVARFARTDQPLYGATMDDRLRAGTHASEETGGVNWYARGHDVKVQLDYTHRATPDALSATSEDRIRLAAQLAF
ncbi:MAG TPA: porin, partial [Polyangia bacterium]|nr:porin [Polyangia bacterium]